MQLHRTFYSGTRALSVITILHNASEAFLRRKQAPFPYVSKLN